MYVYKITNIENNKVYIGQTTGSIQQRFKRHMNDAKHEIIDTKFSRAIRKYGENSFVVECIDTAQTQEELTEKEYYWIKEYNSCSLGYNTSDSKFKCGGNTYQYINNLDEVREKLSISKMGGKNPNSKKIIMINTLTKEKQVFDSMADCARYLGLSSHMPISRRCRKSIKSPLNNIYMFEYFDK